VVASFDTIDHGRLMTLVARRVGDVRVLRLIRAWLKAGVMEEGRVRNPVRGSPQGGVISPLLSNLFLHEIDRQWCDANGDATGPVRLIRYADDMVLLARTAADAQTAWARLQVQFADLRLAVNQEKSQVTTVQAGFRFLGFDIRRPANRPLYLWPSAKARKHIGERVRQTTRSFRSSERLDVVIRKLNPVLNGWCTYFRIGNSNRAFHVVDWTVRRELQLWLRRKHRCTWRHAQKHWNYRYLHDRCRLYRMVGKVSHLEGLRRTPPNEGGRRAGCGKTARPVR
jgi:RNA-directed DNA polymerase